MSGGMRGTLPWMAPELLGGKENKYSEMVILSCVVLTVDSNAS